MNFPKKKNMVLVPPFRLDIQLREKFGLSQGIDYSKSLANPAESNFLIRERIQKFVERQVNIESEMSHAKLSLSSDLNPNGYLFSSVFALKILKMLRSPRPIDLLERVGQSRLAEIPFTEDWLNKGEFFSTGAEFFARGKTPRRQKQERLVAQQRQTLSALKLWGSIPASIQEKTLVAPPDALDWSKPWSAAAQVSHKVFFHTILEKGQSTSLNVSLINDMARELESFLRQSRRSRSEAVNGIMKAVTAAKASGLPLNMDPSEVLDLALQHATEDDACNHFNVLLVLDYFSSMVPSYRRHDVEKYAIDQKKKIMTHFWPEFGGFSFYRRNSQHTYLGIRVGRGLREPDMHGTVMFSWGLSVVESLLSKGDPQTFEVIDS